MVALLREASYVVSERFAWLLLATLEVPRIVRPNIRPLEVFDEDLPEIHPTADAVGGQELEPGANELPEEDWEVLDDEIIIFHPSSSAA